MGAPRFWLVFRAKIISPDSEEHSLTLSAHLQSPLLRWIQAKEAKKKKRLTLDLDPTFQRHQMAIAALKGVSMRGY